MRSRRRGGPRSTGESERSIGYNIKTMTASEAPPVADRAWRVRLLVVDGLLVALLGWLLYIVIRDRERAEQPAESGNSEQVVPANGDTPPTER